MAELGKIEKPSAGDYLEKRKLYCVRNVYFMENVPDDYSELYNAYWDEVDQHLGKLESAGKVKKVFCENIATADDSALDTLGKMNKRALQIVKNKMDEGGTLLPLEKEDIMGPFMDWNNCLMVVRTEDVFKKVHQNYIELLNRRHENMLSVIDGNLEEGEAGLLLLSDEDRVKLQFPNDIAVFLVTPPSYDKILKWLRDRMERQMNKEASGEKPEKNSESKEEPS
jgi:hypothetical protein